jgi:hypothetical protein
MQIEGGGSGHQELVLPRGGTFMRLRTAFAQGGIEGLCEAHRAAARRMSYRVAWWLLEGIFPLAALMDLALGLERRIGEVGAPKACAETLACLPGGWIAEYPKQGREKLIGSPAIIYGVHGSILTPLLVSAALGRDDGKMLGISWLKRLGPNIGRCTFPVFTGSRMSLRSAGRSGLTSRFAGWLTAKFEVETGRDIAVARNRESLSRAVAHVRAGGAVLIAPDPRPPHRGWRRGVGLLAASLAQDPPVADCYLIPMRIWNAPIAAIFHCLSRNPLLRALGRARYRRPVRMTFAEPIPLASVVDAVGFDPARITEHLERHYHDLGF